MEYAYIFDFDGVLVDSNEAQFTCCKKTLEEIDVPIDKEEFYRLSGKTGKEMLLHFCKKVKKDVDIVKLHKRKYEFYKEFQNLIRPIDCNIQLFKNLKKQKIPVAIASGSSRPSIMPVAKKYKLIPDAFVSSEDIKRGKPYPDLFLKAAELLGVEPKYCIVIEDSETGIAAASAAGMMSFQFFNK
jgi:HAD superfamily hydrolase (TIGR01509 family)